MLDEPTANLDPHSVQLFEYFVMNYISSRAACAIWVSHDVEQLKRISKQQYKIQNGQLFNSAKGI